MDAVQPAWVVIPSLAYEWMYQGPAPTMQKFHQFIDYHERVKQPCTADLYRCALVQLSAGLGVERLGVMHPHPGEGFPEAHRRLRLEAGL